MFFKFFTQDRSIYRQLGWHQKRCILKTFLKTSVWNSVCCLTHQNKARFYTSNIQFSFYYNVSFYFAYEVLTRICGTAPYMLLSFNNLIISQDNILDQH